MGMGTVVGRAMRWGMACVLLIGLLASAVNAPPARAAIQTSPQYPTVAKAAAHDVSQAFYNLGLAYKLFGSTETHEQKIARQELINAALILGLIFEFIANDPPDANYTVIAQSGTLSTTPIVADTGVTQQAADAANALVTNLLQTYAVGRALYTAMNRAQGAFQAGASSYVTAQLQAAQGFAAQENTLLAAQPGLLTNASTAFAASGINGSFTAGQIAAFQAQLRSGGLPADLASQLTGFGISGADQATIAQQLAAADPNAAAALGGGQAAQALADPSVLTATQLAGYSLHLFALGLGNGVQFYPLSKPVRLFDSRSAQSACIHPNTPLFAATPLNLVATGSCTGVPSGALALVGNGTVVADVVGSGPGFVAFYPGGAPLPNASNLNYVPGQTAPNAFTVALGSNGSINAYASTRVDLVIDITGVYGPPGLSVSGADVGTAASTPLYYHPLAAPVRLFDSRGGQSACTHPNTPLAATTPLALTATGGCTGIPASALSVVGNGTVVADVPGSGPGFVTFFPGGATLPLASNLNYVPGDVRPNAFTVGLGSGGAFDAYALTATDLVIDVTGYYDANSSGGLLFTPLGAPVRLFDSRAGQSACVTPGAPLAGGSPRNLGAATTCTTVPTNALAIVGNGTVVADVAGSGAGFVTFFPGNKTLPLASNLNYVAGQVAPNAFVVALASNGSFNSYASTATDLVIDITGFFS